MIIVKDKREKSPIYVSRNVLLKTTSSSTPSAGGIDEEELKKYLEEYITEDELQTILDNYTTNDNIVELTKVEYDSLKANGNLDETKIYLITDSTIALKTINGESLVGVGDIIINMEQYVTQEYVDSKLGDIETILDNIIGV